MPIIKTEVKTFKNEYVCDKCDSGKMLPDGSVLMSLPAQFPHACDKCENRMIFLETYPFISHEAGE